MSAYIDLSPAQLKHNFDMYDRDRSGFISIAEMRQVFSRNGSVLSDAAMNYIIQKYDKNKDGQISYSEFCEFITGKPPSHTHQYPSQIQEQPSFPQQNFNNYQQQNNGPSHQQQYSPVQYPQQQQQQPQQAWQSPPCAPNQFGQAGNQAPGSFYAPSIPPGGPGPYQGPNQFAQHQTNQTSYGGYPNQNTAPNNQQNYNTQAYAMQGQYPASNYNKNTNNPPPLENLAQHYLQNQQDAQATRQPAQQPTNQRPKQLDVPHHQKEVSGWLTPTTQVVKSEFH